MTRVAYVCADPGIPVFGTKGASVHIQELVRAWRARGAEVEVYAVRRGDDVPADLADLPVHVVPVAKGPDPAAREVAQQQAAARLAELVLASVPDVVHERYSLFSTVLPRVRAGLAEAARVPSAGLTEGAGVATNGPVEGARVLTILEVNAPLVDEQRTHRVLVDEAGAERALAAQLGAADVVACVSEPVADWVRGHLAATDDACAETVRHIGGPDDGCVTPFLHRGAECPEDGAAGAGGVAVVSGPRVAVAERPAVTATQRAAVAERPAVTATQRAAVAEHPEAGAGGARGATVTAAPRPAIVVTPNGVNTDRIRPVEADLSGAPVVVFVGTLKPWHGVEHLVRAAALARVPWRLRLVGDGPQRAALEELAAQHGVDLELVGAVAPEQVPAALEGALVAAAPYPDSGDHYFSPLKVYEYGAAALPVVASRIGHIPAVVEDGVTGVLVPPSDPAALAAAIDRLVADPQGARRMGAAARTHMESHHSWSHVLDATLAPAG